MSEQFRAAEIRMGPMLMKMAVSLDKTRFVLTKHQDGGDVDENGDFH